jgi:cardiolipin synthase
MLTSLPNLLTLSRIAIIPVVVGLFYVPEAWAAYTACTLFAAACITDYIDGYLARAWEQESVIGKFLDPIADKLLVSATLIMLVAVMRISGLSVLAAVVILLREVLVSGLREYLAGLNVSVPVTRLGKWKTMIQMVALSFLIVGDYGPAEIPVTIIGTVGLWGAAILTFISGWDYMRAGMRHMMEDSASKRADRTPSGSARTTG